MPEAAAARAYLMRDCLRLIHQDRNHFAAAMIANGDADAMVTGVTRNFSIALQRGAAASWTRETGPPR